jgi:hypothetical protein
MAMVSSASHGPLSALLSVSILAFSLNSTKKERIGTICGDQLTDGEENAILGALFGDESKQFAE